MSVFPDLSPWTREVASKDPLRIWLLSLENWRLVMPLECAFSNLRRHCPVDIFQTRIYSKKNEGKQFPGLVFKKKYKSI